MHEFYVITREDGWLRAHAIAPGERIVQRSGIRTDVAGSILTHATGDLELSIGLADRFVDAFLRAIPDGGIPLVIRTSDLLLWVVRQLREETP